MRHIQPYNPTYKEISWLTFHHSDYVELSNINGLIPKLKELYHDFNIDIKKNRYYNYIEMHDTQVHKSNFIKPQIRIHELADEWFVVRKYPNHKDGNRYYKCDQIEGLVDCLDYIQKIFNK